MYFNEKRENTNIDKELSKNKRINFNDIFNKYKRQLIVFGVALLLIIIIIILVVSLRNRNQYYIKLEGNSTIKIYQGTTYNEPGYTGYDSQNNKHSVTVKGNVDSSKIGTYTLTYSLKKAKSYRTIIVISPPTVLSVIHLEGDKKITIERNGTYNEPGYTAIDYADGDVTDKVTINSNVDTNKQGTYRIIYSLVNSSGVTISETRTVIVK